MRSIRRRICSLCYQGADLELVDCRWQGISWHRRISIIVSDGLETLADSEIEVVCKRLEATSYY